MTRTDLAPTAATNGNGHGHGSLPSDWKDWEDTFADVNAFWTTGPASPTPSAAALGAFDFDLGLDAFLLSATEESVADPLASLTAPMAPSFSFNDLLAIGSPLPDLTNPVSPASTTTSEEVDASDREDFAAPSAMPKVAPIKVEKAMTQTAPAVKAQRKRKNAETTLSTSKTTAKAAPVVSGKKIKADAAGKRKAKTDVAAMERAEKLHRKRFDILHEILEAWNTGGIEDMEEIAPDVYHDDVVLISPDYSEGLKGVKLIMEHWNMLLDAFPDGIMEEYDIEREDVAGDKMRVSWVFSGTQIFPFFGVQPRHEKVTIKGKSFFTFKGDKISEMVLSWNYREAMLKLMGLKPGSEAATNFARPSSAGTSALPTNVKR